MGETTNTDEESDIRTVHKRHNRRSFTILYKSTMTPIKPRIENQRAMKTDSLWWGLACLLPQIGPVESERAHF